MSSKAKSHERNVIRTARKRMSRRQQRQEMKDDKKMKKETRRHQKFNLGSTVSPLAV